MDGKKVAGLVRDELRAEVEKLTAGGARSPGLAVVLVGDNPASHIYVKNKIQSCKKVGIESFFHQFPADATAEQILTCIQQLNDSPIVDGILVQLPLPVHLPTDEILQAVAPHKDADGLHPHNLGLLLAGKPGLRPCTPQGVMVLLEHYGIELAGCQATVIGRSNLVGKPISMMLMEKNATVTMCHSKSRNLDKIAAAADVLVVAAGKDSLVRGSWIKPQAVVIDVGIHRRENADGTSEVVGDVDYKEASQVASLITPVPGGVGPMTVAMLLRNTVEAYKAHLLSPVK